MEHIKYLLSNNKFDDALCLLKKCIKKNPENIEVIFHLGKTYFYLKKYSLAKIYFQKIIKTNNIDNITLLWSKYFIANILKLKSPIKALDILISIREINTSDIDKEINILLCDILKLIQQYNFCGKYSKSKKLYSKYHKYILQQDSFISNKFLNEYEIASQKTVLQSKPRYMLVILSNQCNINCIMCYQRQENRFSINNKLISIIKENSKYLEKIIWQGGEPFLFPNFKNLLIDFSKNKYLKQIIITNFLLVNNDIIEFLVSNKIKITVSIDGAKKETYEQIRKGASFDKLIYNLNLYNEILQKYNINENLLHINFVVMKENYKEIIDIIEFAHKYNITNISFIRCIYNIANNQQRLNSQEILYIKEKLLPMAYEKAAKYCINIDNQLDSIFDTDIIKNINKRISQNKLLNCHLPWQELTISYENIIKANCLCLLEQNYNVNNINELTDLWNSKALVDLRKNIINDNLLHCNEVCTYIDKNYLKPIF